MQAQVGKAGSKPALPRNCGEQRNNASPSQTTDGAMKPIGPSRVREASGARAFFFSFARGPAAAHFLARKRGGLVKSRHPVVTLVPVALDEDSHSAQGRQPSPPHREAKFLTLPEVNLVQPGVNDVYSRVHSRRHLASFLASILAHAAVIALILYSAPRLSEGGHDWLLAYLVEVGPGKGGTVGGRKGPPVIQVEPASMPDEPIRSDLPDNAVASTSPDLDARYETRTLPRPGVMASLSANALRSYGGKSTGRGPSSQYGGSVAGAGSVHRSGSGDATGDGLGRAGVRIAHADYAANPAPAYPARSRRRAEQGTVTLHVLVAIDGSVARIEIADSSGFADLDQSALETVRERWRFVPAKRSDGRAVESWVLVPIRFALR